jgi:hypothetical protein
MGPVTHQTIRLSRGKHSSPGEGACVMELASMLAGERFSDHPVSVCPVIGSFLRTYNDSIDAERRQDLYAYAAKVVGSRGSEELQRARAERLNAWVSERKPRRWTRFLLPAFLPALASMPANDVLGIRAVQAVLGHDDRTHAEVLALIDELLALRTSDRALPTTTPPGASASPRTVSARR